MTDSLKTHLMEQLTDLHDSVVLHLDECSARDVLGDDLDQLRKSGTGKSLVMLALLDDLLRMTEILLAERWNPLERDFAEFAAPFFQSAAKTFARKGLTQYAPYAHLAPENAGEFLAFHWKSTRPFGGQHAPTQWSGLHICTNVALRYGNMAALDGYERLTQALLSLLTERMRRADRDQIAQLSEFISDRCTAVRDQLEARRRNGPADEDLSTAREELAALRAELESQQAQLAKRESLMEREWKRFQQDRAEFEQIRQQWEEHLADQAGDSAEENRPDGEREELARQLSAVQRERELLEREREKLWHEREELAALREQLEAQQGFAEEPVLFEPEPPAEARRKSAAAKNSKKSRL